MELELPMFVKNPHGIDVKAWCVTCANLDTCMGGKVNERNLHMELHQPCWVMKDAYKRVGDASRSGIVRRLEYEHKQVYDHNGKPVIVMDNGVPKRQVKLESVFREVIM